MKANDYDFDMEDALQQASANAKTPWEDNFVEGLQDKFESYGDDMFLSEKQAEILCRIAKIDA